MRCDRSRELVSARLDGEGGDRSEDLHEHLAGCPACRSWTARAEVLHRSLRVHPAPAVPDLSADIVARLLPGGRARRRSPARLSVLRGLLVVVAGTQAVLALPEVLGLAQHSQGGRHLGGWDAAFAVGLLVAAAQPWRARGLLPMAAAVGSVMAVMVVADGVSGAPAGMTQMAHALELGGLALLWAISRLERRAGLDGGGRRWRRRRHPLVPMGQRSTPPSAASSVPSSRITASRARATRERTVPTGQSHTDAVSA